MNQKQEFAPGLPDKTRVDPIDMKGQTRMVIQQHKATNDHYDMRLQDGDIAHSWVIRSLPGVKDKILAVRQPTHTSQYMNFQGVIPEGYGKGDVKKVYDEPIDIVYGNDQKIKLVLPEGEFTMIKTKGDTAWLMIKNKNKIDDPISSKPKYKTITENESGINNPDAVWQPKADGAHTIFRLNADGINRIYSYRNRKNTNEPIEHTHQVPEIRDAEVPKEFGNIELRGELYAQKDGKPVDPEIITGMLNAKPAESIKKQEQIGKLKPMIFDVAKVHGEDYSNKTYDEKRRIIELIASKIPILSPAPEAYTQEEKEKLLLAIKSGQHPDTKEGIVEWDVTKPGGDPKKLKLRDTHEVYIRDIYPAVTKTKDRNIAGGFRYSWTPEGNIVGNVGTGFSEKMRKEMLQQPENFIDRLARVKTQKVFQSGAMRAPSFYSMHVEENLDKEANFMVTKTLEQIISNSFYNELEKIAVAKPTVRNVKRILQLGLDEMSKRNIVNRNMGGKILNFLKEYRYPIVSGAASGLVATVPSLLLSRKITKPYVLFQVVKNEK